MAKFSLEMLEKVIDDRKNAAAEVSYTRSLLDAGAARVAKKFGEEAIETVIAAVNSDKADFIGEAADALYHLLVLLRSRNTHLSEVLAELERRTAMSGHAEKAGRKK